MSAIETQAGLASEARALADKLERGITGPTSEVIDMLRALAWPAQSHEEILRDAPLFVPKEAGPELFYLGVDGTLYQLGEPDHLTMPTRDAVIMRALLSHALGQEPGKPGDDR